MNIWLGTYLNLMHLTILNVNFHSYQMNNCNCINDITKNFCCCFNASEGNLFLFIFLSNRLADKFVPSNWLTEKLSCFATQHNI